MCVCVCLCVCVCVCVCVFCCVCVLCVWFAMLCDKRLSPIKVDLDSVGHCCLVVTCVLTEPIGGMVQ